MTNLLKIENLCKRFHSKNNLLNIIRPEFDGVKALDNITFNIKENEIIGLVGESGSGKTTLARTLMRLTEPDKGNAYFKNRDIFKMSNNNVKMIIRKKFRMIFQHPDATLNPSYPVKMVFDQANKTNKDAKHSFSSYISILENVGLNEDFLEKMPHELSGGEKRRINICRALLTKPQLIFADEPTSSLDLYLQYQILNILENIRYMYKISIVLISHDIGIVKKISDRICVMYKGQIVELGPSETMTSDASLHPYTKDLFRSDLGLHPSLDEEKEFFNTDFEKKFSNLNSNEQCPYLKNCIKYRKHNYPSICSTKKPLLKKVKNDHYVACHLK